MSCATPPARLPRLSSRCARLSCDSSRRRSSSARRRSLTSRNIPWNTRRPPTLSSSARIATGTRVPSARNTSSSFSAPLLATWCRNLSRAASGSGCSRDWCIPTISDSGRPSRLQAARLASMICPESGSATKIESGALSNRARKRSWLSRRAISTSLRSVMSWIMPTSTSGAPSAAVSSSPRPCTQRTAPSAGRNTRYSRSNGWRAPNDGLEQVGLHPGAIVGVDEGEPSRGVTGVVETGDAEDLVQQRRALPAVGRDAEAVPAKAGDALGLGEQCRSGIAGSCSRTRRRPAHELAQAPKPRHGAPPTRTSSAAMVRPARGHGKRPPPAPPARTPRPALPHGLARALVGTDTRERMRQKRVLVVDDDFGVRRGIGAVLSAKGYEVDLADSCAAAQEIVRTRPPDALLLDQQLPDGTGLELMGALRRGVPGRTRHPADGARLDRAGGEGDQGGRRAVPHQARRPAGRSWSIERRARGPAQQRRRQRGGRPPRAHGRSPIRSSASSPAIRELAEDCRASRRPTRPC